MCYERVGMSDSAEKSVYYPQFYDHKSHMKGQVYNDRARWQCLSRPLSPIRKRARWTGARPSPNECR